VKLLIIGGSRFLGRHLVMSALAGHHEITLFNRGQHRSTDLPNVETILGDRNSDLVNLQGRRWDAVVDTCGYLPRTVRQSADFLSQSVDRYVFISSLSVYADLSVVGVNEKAPLKKLTDEQLEKANEIDATGQTSAITYGEMYGGLKARCEQAVEEVMPGRTMIIRPGLIVGPHDYTDRFTYWVLRVAGGGEVLAPGRPTRPVQFIDARDLADWILRMIDVQGTGVYNANGLPDSMSMENLLNECKLTSGSDASFIWASEEFLKQEGVAAWSEMPLWLPESAPHLKGFMFVNSDKAVATGLTTRALSDTVRDTLSWYKAERSSNSLAAGMDLEREARLLRKFHSTH
jgi:2'-hydroxyisoflavone reductase